MPRTPATTTHTYSDGSQIELGSAPGKGWLDSLKAGDPTGIRPITGRRALRMRPEDTIRPDRAF